MFDKIKNFFIPLVGIAVVILDEGFDVIAPLFADFNISNEWVKSIKVIFAIYGIYKMATNKSVLRKEDIGGTIPPIKTDEK